jgi:serine/threonine-protein kinase
MGEVFRAEHRQLGQIRGLKVLLPEASPSPELLGRLLMEARTMALLRHPNIAEVYDCDVLGDSAFIAMEYLPGITLRTWSDHVGKLSRSPRLAAVIAGTLADALAFAHQHGIVHRDLKPENVLLVPVPGDPHGFTLKILDFGLAKRVSEQPAVPSIPGVSPDHPVAATQYGRVVGTPLYMAPEQCAGDPIDHRADVYALGCVLFELLCGRPPFCGSDAVGIMQAHLFQPPPDVTHLEPRIPWRFQALLARMLAKSPAHRQAGMEEVLSELEALSHRPRTRWKEALRTPSAGAVAVRRPLVINLEKTLVDRVGLRERLWQFCKRRVSARVARLAVITCASVIAGGSLLLVLFGVSR